MTQPPKASAKVLYYAAAVATAIAGVLHLMLGPNSLGFSVNQGILFIAGGIAQVFWIIPAVRRWGTPWYAIGIGGTIVLIALWVITRMPGNPITGREGPVSPTALAIEVAQAAFVGLAAAIIAYESRRKKQPAATSVSKSRRQAPILAGIVAALVLLGLLVLPMTMGQPGGPQGGGPVGTQMQVGTSTNLTCTITPSLIEVEGTPQQTEGPYFVDGMPERSDIRSDLSDGSVQEGIPLSLVINVYDVGNDGNCVPVSGAQVDIWHANFQGVYSGVQEQGTVGKNFLRGYQVTDDNGTVRFSTVYPGWYEGRAIHIHVKVRTLDGSGTEWTSQFYLPDSVNEQVHTQTLYSTHRQPDTTNHEDGIFTGASTDGLVQSNTGEHLMLNLNGDNKQGYTGTFNIVLETGRSG